MNRILTDHIRQETDRLREDIAKSDRDLRSEIAQLRSENKQLHESGRRSHLDQTNLHEEVASLRGENEQIHEICRKMQHDLDMKTKEVNTNLLFLEGFKIVCLMSPDLVMYCFLLICRRSLILVHVTLDWFTTAFISPNRYSQCFTSHRPA